MKVIVDTSAWSLALRRKSPHADVFTEVERLVRRGRVQMLGVIRQESLSGIETAERFADLRDQLAHFPDFPVTSRDHEDAARAYNKCRGHGVQGNVVDMLICAVALRHDLSVFTFDRDFENYHRFLKFKRHRPGA
jgi:predicted nucleic acid-binding protein